MKGTNLLNFQKRNSEQYVFHAKRHYLKQLVGFNKQLEEEVKRRKEKEKIDRLQYEHQFIQSNQKQFMAEMLIKQTNRFKTQQMLRFQYDQQVRSKREMIENQKFREKSWARIEQQSRQYEQERRIDDQLRVYRRRNFIASRSEPKSALHLHYAQLETSENNPQQRERAHDLSDDSLDGGPKQKKSNQAPQEQTSYRKSFLKPYRIQVVEDKDIKKQRSQSLHFQGAKGYKINYHLVDRGTQSEDVVALAQGRSLCEFQHNRMKTLPLTLDEIQQNSIKHLESQPIRGETRQRNIIMAKDSTQIGVPYNYKNDQNIESIESYRNGVAIQDSLDRLQSQLSDKRQIKLSLGNFRTQQLPNPYAYPSSANYNSSKSQRYLY